MGAYLSAPRTEKDSIDEKNERLVCGASSMQGWRINQEDAHNCELNFDDDTSFFAVYDGHGGPEIALYCSKYLPAFLKATESYTRGEFEQALRDAFLGFDAKLLLGDVIEELKVLAGDKYSYDDEDGEGSDSDEDLAELKQEGGMPIEAVLSKYREMMKKVGTLDRLKEGEVGAGGSSTAFKPHSPCLRAKKQSIISTSNGGGSSEHKPSDSSEEAVSSSSSGKNTTTNAAAAEETPSASSSLVTPSNDTVAPSEVEESAGSSSSKPATTSKDVESPDSSSSDGKIGNSVAGASSIAETANDVSSSSSTKATGSALSSSADAAPSVGCSSSSSSAGMPAEGGAGSSENVNGESSSTTASASISSTNMDRAAKRVARAINQADGDESESDEEEKDMTYSEHNSPSSDLNSDESDEDNMEEEDDEDEEDDEEGEEEAEEEDAFISNMVEEPGKDSGCTAVVALLKGRDLYVANAGDSRCVLSRGGKVVEMSFDHKPEDREEHMRISKAGGKVTLDGRVNGGLNLSRAIGDHAYKMNSELPAEEQMISAKPDIQKTTLTDEDEFMVLACDGIWNFMSSKAVVNFVKERLDKGETQLSRICEELFDYCLAKDTSGDGTGCDNMTAIIVRFKWSQNSITNEAEVVAEIGIKRSASTEGSGTGDCDMKAKRAKTDAEADAPSTTST